jgi:hypothetical protein
MSICIIHFVAFNFQLAYPILYIVMTKDVRVSIVSTPEIDGGGIAGPASPHSATGEVTTGQGKFLLFPLPFSIFMKNV